VGKFRPTKLLKCQVVWKCRAEIFWAGFGAKQVNNTSLSVIEDDMLPTIINWIWKIIQRLLSLPCPILHA
jgi:hypothetical protein